MWLSQWGTVNIKSSSSDDAISFLDGPKTGMTFCYLAQSSELIFLRTGLEYVSVSICIVSIKTRLSDRLLPLFKWRYQEVLFDRITTLFAKW